MTVVVVLAILIAVGSPSLAAVINGNRLSNAANEMVSSLQMARNEALHRNHSVKICPSNADGSACATSASTWQRWLVVSIDATTTTTTVLRDVQIQAPVQFYPGELTDITFKSDGLAHTADGGLLDANLGACVATTHPAQNRRVITITAGSRFAVTDDGNGDGTCTVPSGAGAGSDADSPT